MTAQEISAAAVAETSRTMSGCTSGSPPWSVMYRMPRRWRIGNARANAFASTYRAGPANVLSRAKPQKSHAALHTFVTETSQTAGSTKFGILWFAKMAEIRRLLPLTPALSPLAGRGRDPRREGEGLLLLIVDWIANDWAGHAMSAAAAAPGLGANDRDHLN